MFKGYRTYIAIVLTAGVVLTQYFGLVSDDLMAPIVTILSALGLYYRSQAGK